MSLTQYLLEFSICLALFYALYHFLLRKETFFQLNRWYLLLSPMLSMIIPFIDVELPMESEAGQWENMVIPIVADIQQQQHMIWGKLEKAPAADWTITYLDLLFFIYLIGVWYMSYKLFRRTWSLMRIIGQGKHEKKGGYTMVHTLDRLPAASFLSYVFWEETPLDPERKKILEHELVHVRQWHTLDVLLMEIWVMLKWFHPLIYWYRNSLRLTHEYIADAYVSKAGGSRLEYAQVLTRSSTEKVNNHLMHQFNASLKKRLLMLSKHQSEKWKYLKYLFIGPVTGLLFVLFSLNQSKDLPEPIIQSLTEAETVINRAVNQPIVSGDEMIDDADESSYTLRWGDKACTCRTKQYDHLFFCDDQIMKPEIFLALIKNEGGFYLEQGGMRQPITDLTAVSRSMKDMGGFKGQFDEMGNSLNEHSPFWDQVAFGDVFRFTFRSGETAHFQFELVLSDSENAYPFGEKIVIGDREYSLSGSNSHFDVYRQSAIVEMSLQEVKQLLRYPLKVKRSDNTFYKVTTASVISRKTLRADGLKSVNDFAVNLSQERTLHEIRPGDDLQIHMRTVDDQRISIHIRINRQPDQAVEPRSVRIEWGDLLFDPNQGLILSKAELLRMVDQDIYLLYDGYPYSVKPEATMNDAHFFSDKNVKIIKYREAFRAIIDRAQPGGSILLGGMGTEDDYVVPIFRVHIDYDWREVFADHPAVSFSVDGKRVTLQPAQPEDLQTVLALPNFRAAPYRIEADEVKMSSEMGSDYTELLKAIVQDGRPNKKLVITRRDCLNCPRE